MPHAPICYRENPRKRSNQLSHCRNKQSCMYTWTYKGSFNIHGTLILMRQNHRGCMNGALCFSPWHRALSRDKPFMQHPVHSLAQYRGIIRSRRGDSAHSVPPVPHHPPILLPVGPRYPPPQIPTQPHPSTNLPLSAPFAVPIPLSKTPHPPPPHHPSRTIRAGSCSLHVSFTEYGCG